VDELEIDVAFALEPQAPVAALYAFSPDPSPEHYRFAVALQPFSMQEVVAAHRAITDAAGRGVGGRILYFDMRRPAPFVDKTGRRVRIEPSMRGDAIRRAQEREADRGLHDLEDLVAMKLALGREVSDRMVSMALGTWIVEIVSDPFPSPPSRVLIIDDAPEADAIVLDDRLEVCRERDPWVAVDRIARERFDLIVCAAKLEELSGQQVYRLAVAQRAEVARRFAFLASPDVLATVDESRRRNTLSRPIQAAAIRELLARSRGAM
jgi:hypothetical protein